LRTSEVGGGVVVARVCLATVYTRETKANGSTGRSVVDIGMREVVARLAIRLFTCRAVVTSPSKEAALVRCRARSRS
jgi:hypothetical protein